MLWCDSVAPLGNPVVPLVYWMLIGSSNDRLASRSASGSRAGGGRAGREQRVPAPRAEVDDLLQVRQIGPDLLDHRAVVAGLEALRADQHPHAGLAQHEAELVAAVRRVDVDEDDPALAVAYCSRTHSAQFGAQMPTRSPAASPAAIRPRASVSVSASNCRVRPPPARRHVDKHLGVRVRGGDPPQVRRRSSRRAAGCADAPWL